MYKSICKNCYFAGNVAEKLRDEGYIGCRKPLAIAQDTLNTGTWLQASAEDLSNKVYKKLECEEAALGWVDNGQLDHPTGRQFNGILITKGTRNCEFFLKKN